MTEAMDCAQVRMHFALLLYGELSFDEEERVETHLDGCAECRADLERQRSLHAALDGMAAEPPPSLLRECRAELAAALRETPVPRPVHGWWDRFVDLLNGSSILRPAGAIALVMIGFFGARLAPYLTENLTGANQAGLTRVSDVETMPDGSVRIVVDQTNQKTIRGNLEDQQIRNLLLEAVRDANNPGLRTDSVGLLTRAAQSSDIRNVLVYLVSHDQNDGVRLKAMEGLRQFASEPDVRGALSQVLLSDGNPGVRTQAIELLIQAPDGGSLPTLDRAMVGTLQELMLRERNESVRQRAERVLQAVNASAEIY